MASVAVGWALAGHAQAAPLDYLSDARQVTAAVSVSYYTSWGSDYYTYDVWDVPNAPFADFDGDATVDDGFWGNSGSYEGHGQATQVSTLGPDRIQVSGQAEAWGGQGGGAGGDPLDEASYWYEDVWVDGEAASEFDITFGVAEPTAIELWATLPDGKTQSRITLRNFDTSEMLFDTNGLLGFEWLESFILPAGRYHLSGGSQAWGIDDLERFALDLTATPVPEPGTLVLMGVGIAGCAMRRGHGRTCDRRSARSRMA